MSQAVTDGRVAQSLERFSHVEDTDEGARLQTHCLYPSFDPVCTFIAKVGDGFRVHDGGGAYRSAWSHGREDATIRRALGQQAMNYDLEVVQDSLVGQAADEDWLVSTILSVANASAAAALTAVTHSASAGEDALRNRIYQALSRLLPPAMFTRSWGMYGKSGKHHEFDFGVRLPHERWLLIESVSPHHVSVSSKYVAFADTRDGSEDIAARFAVYDRPLSLDDAALMQQVADLVPVTSMSSGVEREMAH